MEKMDIKSLANALKNATPVATPGELVKPEQKSKTLPSEADLLSFIRMVNEREDYRLRHSIYIDTGIHEILRQIKSQTRLRIGYLVSVLLEDFILQHKEEIVQLLDKKDKRIL